MAPTTRLRLRPERRVNYSDTRRRAGTRGNPIVLVETPGIRGSNRVLSGKSSKPAEPSRNASNGGKSGNSKVSRVQAGAVVKPKAATKKQAKEKESAKQECLVCVENKMKYRCFKAPEDACEHLQSICTLCITKMLRTNMTERQLTEAELSCPFGNCDHVLEYAALRAKVTKPTFTSYDDAVTKHALSTGELYTARLSSKCGLHFTIEDCTKGKRRKKFIECPYCENRTCVKCDRSWDTRGRGGCDKVRMAEDKASEAAVKELGAKPCPECGINIQKNWGCDHMICNKCNHHFCRLCLEPYRGDARHRADYPTLRTNIAADPRNWVPGHADDAQLVGLINRAVAARNGQPMRARVPAARRPGLALGPEREDDDARADVLKDAIIIAPEHLGRVRAMAAQPR